MSGKLGYFLDFKLKSTGRIDRKIIKMIIGKMYFSIPGITEPKKKPKRERPTAQRKAPITL